MLGGGEVLDVGESHTQESALSGTSDVTVVAAQAPTTEVKSASSDGQTEAGSADPLLSATGTTRLPDPRAQAPIGSTQVPPLSLSRGMSQCRSLQLLWFQQRTVIVKIESRYRAARRYNTDLRRQLCCASNAALEIADTMVHFGISSTCRICQYQPNLKISYC